MKMGSKAALAAAAAVMAAFPSAAMAGDQLWWSNYNPPGSVSKIELATGIGTNLITGTPSVNGPYGTAADPANGKIYWASYDSGQIASAGLDGAGKQPVLTTTVSGPYGLAIDPVGQHLFWAEKFAKTIRRVGTNGVGSTALFVDSDLVVSPVVDPAARRVYWVKISSPAKIANGSVDGVTGDPIPISASCPYGASTGPGSIAVDSSRGIIYMGTAGGSTGIARMNLDGSDCQPVTATTGPPTGLALDPDAQRLYWADYNNHQLRYVNLDPLGTQQTVTQTGATLSYPSWPVLIKAPAGSASVSPTSSETGATLTCTSTWSQGAVAASMYRAPQSTTYAWTRNGQTIPGATGSTLVTDSAGSYGCTATGTNAAGSTAISSAAVEVSASPEPEPDPLPPIPPLPPLPPIPTPPNAFTVSGSASTGSRALRTRATVPGPGVLRQAGIRSPGSRAAAVTGACSGALKIPAAGTYTIACTTTSATRRAQRNGKVRIVLTTSFTPTGGQTASSSRVVVLPALKPRFTG